MTTGREVEHALLDVVVSEVAAGSPRTVVVRGAPGTGRSTLLRRLRSVAAAEGFTIVDSPRQCPLSCSGPVLFAIDDLHRAGPATAWFVARLLRRPQEGPLLVAATVPADAVAPWLRRALRVAERHGTLTGIELAAPHAEAQARPGPSAQRAPATRVTIPG